MKVVGCSHSKTSNKLQMSWQLDFNSAQSKAYRRGPISLSGHAKPFVRYLCESLTWLTYSLCNQIHFFLEPIFKNTFYKAFNLPMERVDQYRDQAAVQWTRLHNTYQRYLDIATPHTVYRWAATYVLMFLFALRIVLCEGWYIVCYTWAIYLLSMLLQFLTPKFDPSLEQEYENESIEEGTAKMSDKDEEFRPFIRRLPEFRFWLNATRGTIVALVCSLFRVFDIPVFWPILLVYFVILFTLTMRRQIQHMIKYRYLPFDIGKARYGRK
ncbi:hypothetical protein KL930_000265 [Ogataea haglerorum]|uniref:uncharacterized protein n=1 Tax=Ogataea haglerorum TaxID=1937702 RepID=UPI001C88F67B|nr:uncharacterized protein KL911_000866 [Ogataea haglerorum]KAG7697680.1 hypothetical protein KL951_002254 [Ogataea haglerorum]KAG7701281.1 hypothetical protein KL915_000312 [Ogataea haglerorum]KAG7706500.1 hypothetical protein KL950_003165 [Ogataea haglerorum]KAG7709239.1 hypothetical protein KL914_001629 [Ogataea haglerorum]KAG7717897.1 hypothetical protein KL913_002833 [Ogataea haglerorum]